MVKLLRALVLALPCACHDENPRFTLADTDAGEATDDVGAASSDASTAGTTSDEATTACGDGVIDHPFETCDDGPQNAAAGACTPGCQAAYCGDGYVYQGFESCDDGNLVGYDGCDLECKPTPRAVDLDEDVMLTDLLGAPNGTLYEEECPVLLGFYGLEDFMTGVSTLGGICGELALGVADDAFVIKASATGEVLSNVGTSGYQIWIAMCPADKVITGVSGEYDGSISELVFLCSRLTVTDQGGAYAVSVTDDLYIDPVGVPNGGPEAYAVCPLGYVATAQRIYQDNDTLLAGVGLACKAPLLSQ